MIRTLKTLHDIFLSADRVVIDTGPLLIHATGVFRSDKLGDICLCGAPVEEFNFLDRLFISNQQFCITPYILSELLYRVRSEFKLKREGIEEFFHSYGMFLSKIGEIRIDKEKIIQDDGIKFGLADVSLLKAYEETDALILSSDESFCRFCEWRNIEFIEYKTFFFDSAEMMRMPNANLHRK